MKHDPSRPQGPAWRQQPGAGKRNPKAQQDWRQDVTPAASAGHRLSRRAKIGFGVGTLASLVAITVVVIFLLRPANPATWVLLGTRDWDNLDLPPNVEGYNGLVKFAEWTQHDRPAFLWGRNLPHILRGGKPVEFKKDTDWFAEVDEARKKESAIVLYFCAPGGADAVGPFLFYGDARSDDDPKKSRLYISDILAKLEDLPKNKVLILDATQNGANWPFGQMYNDFARRLIELDQRIQQIPNLIVISSSGPDQRSWPSDAVGQTFFGYYLLKGMRGQAANGESVVRAGGLFDYVNKQVAHAVRANRLAEQTPILLPRNGGHELAQKIVLTRVTGSGDDDSSAKPAEVDTAAIKKRWERCKELSRMPPPPYVNHPQLWRQYRDCCLRYEQLLRAGVAADDRTVRALDARITDLESSNKLNVSIPGTTTVLENSLAMPAALGVALSAEEDEQVRAAWRRLWQAKDDEREDAWKALQGLVKGPVKEKALRLRCGSLLLEDLGGTADAAARSKAGKVLALIGGTPRPAELHFLYMLLNNLHGEPDTQVLQLACRTRRLAEEAALAVPPPDGAVAYSAQVYPWIQRKIQAADEARRQGEDLLFSSVKEDWKQAEDHLNKAYPLYEKARDDGRKVAQALAWRDRLFAVLPDFSHYLAGRFVDANSPAATEVADQISKVQDLWVRAHRLDSLLAKPDDGAIDELVKVTKEVNDPFENLVKAFNHQWKSHADQATNQEYWHEIEDLLAVSWADPELLPDQEPDRRRVLIENRRDVSKILWNKAEAPDASKKAWTPDAWLAASHQARLAVDALGERWVDQHRKGSDTKYGMLRDFVASPSPANWHDSLAKPADQVGRLWQQIPRTIKEQGDEVRAPEVTLKTAGTALAEADWLCRLIDGPAVGRIAGDPAADARRLQWHNLFIALGQRTDDDQWYGTGTGEPYYRTLGRKYKDEAFRLVSALPHKGNPSKALLVAAEGLLNELSKPSKLELKGPKAGQENITSEKQFELDFRLAGGPGLKPGFAVLGVTKVGDAFAPQFRDSLEVRARKVAPGDDGKDIAYRLNLAGDGGGEADSDRKIVVEAFYRGQKLSHPIIGEIHAPDTVITFNPRPKDASLTILSDSAVAQQFAPKNSVLTIVLDCSGSMWAGLKDPPLPEFKTIPDVKQAEDDRKNGKWKGQLRRFDKAVESLNIVLANLKPGVTVSVWTFAQLENKGAIQRIWEPKEWAPGDRTDLMAKVRALVPCYETPLAMAMYRAQADFDPKLKGFKNLVVLTDGMDNRFKPERLKNGEEDECAGLRQQFGTDDIPTFLLKAFENSGINIYMALFDVEEKELPTAKKQFGGIGQVDPSGKIRLPGEVREIKDDPKELVRYLRRAMRFDLRFWLYREGRKLTESGFPVIPLAQGKDRENLAWPRLDATSYTVRVNDQFPQGVTLDKGDLIVATVHQDDKKVYLDRALYGRDTAGKNQTQEIGKTGWWLSLLGGEDRENKLKLMMSLEKEPPAKEPFGRPIIEQVRPRFVWFEVQGKGAKNPKLYWNNFELFPAPAWNLEVRDWVPGASPAASVWWNADWDLTSARIDTLQRRLNEVSDVNQDFTNRKTTGFKIMRVFVDNHHINDKVGTKTCLVVRAAYDPGKPILIRLKNMPGATDEQAQHYYYSTRNEYTGYFWPVTEADLSKPFKLEIISVDEFKQKAQQRGTFIEKWSPPILNNLAPLFVNLKDKSEFED